MKHQPAKWLRWGLLVALVIAAGLLQTSPIPTQAQGGGTLTYGSKVFGTISEDLPRATYSFTGAAGDVVNIMVESWSGNLDLRAELVAPNGLVLDSSVQNTLDDSPQGATVSAVLPGEGIYLLWITGENGTTGDFALTLLGRGAVTSTPLIFGQAVNVIIPLDAPPQFYSFETEDCPTTLLVSEPSEGQPFAFPFVVKVHDQRGQPVALLTGGEQVEDWVTVAPRSGRYEVEVLAADPALAGSIRLLVTCSGGAPGCAEGQPGIPGIPGVVTTAPAECEPCPGPCELTGGGGCPDLRFTLEQAPDDPFRITASWEGVPGATGYAVYVYGRYPDGGEVYLTHGEWVPGDPTAFTWPLPDTVSGFRFVLRVYIGEDMVCTTEAGLEFEPPPDERWPVCAFFEVLITARTDTSFTVEWGDYPDAEHYAFSILDATSTLVPGYPVILPADQHSLVVEGLGAGAYTIVVGPWADPGGMYCPGVASLEFEPPPDERWPACVSFEVLITARTDTSFTVEWGDYPDAEHYAFSILDATSTLVPGYPVILPADQHSLVVEGLGAGAYTIVVGPWADPGGMYCPGEALIGIQEVPGQQQAPCLIRADRADVRARIGPGMERAAFAFLTPGIEYPVIGQALDGFGNLWWQIDKTLIPGHEAALSLWVDASEVIAIGDCNNVPQSDVPPVIPWEPEPEEPEIPDEPPPPGGWLPCGSCDTCGHPANECVTSPEGACLWDPTTCLGLEEVPPPEDGGEPPPECYHITVTVDNQCQYSAASAMIDVAPNCDGGYAPGTTISAHAVGVDPKCAVSSWSGCGVSGGGSSVSFTATGSCTLVAHMSYQ